MSKFKIYKIALVVFVLFTAKTEAQNLTENSDANNYKHNLSMCPFGIVLGIYSINYEYLFAEHHGIVARLDYEAVPKSYDGGNLNVDGKAAILNYRYHFSGKLESIYLGFYGRYRIYDGAGIAEETKYDFDISEFTIGANVGKKWVWNSGFTINFALGYGHSFQDKSISVANQATENAVKDFEKNYDFIDAFLGELSIGYAF